jgi:hypothetical protein
VDGAKATSLTDKISSCSDAAARRVLSTELFRLRKTLDTFSVVKPDRDPEYSRVPLPRSYVEERRAKIENAAMVSKRKGMRIIFVQGGSPGVGRGGRGK